MEKFNFVCSCRKKFRVQAEAVKHLEDNQAYKKVKVGHEMQGYFIGDPPRFHLETL